MSSDRGKRTFIDASRRRAFALGTAFALAVLAVPSARAATVVWGGGNGTFSATYKLGSAVSSVSYNTSTNGNAGAYMVGTTNGKLFYIDKVSDGDAYL